MGIRDSLINLIWLVAGKQTAADAALHATSPGSGMQFHEVSPEQKAKYPHYYKE